MNDWYCSRCGYAYQSESGTSFLMFQKSLCPQCKKTNYGPLHRWARITHWLIILSVFIGMPILFIFPSIFALIQDYRARR